MIYEATRTVSPREQAEIATRLTNSDRTQQLLRVDMPDNFSIEFRPAGKAYPGLFNMNLHDALDDVVAQVTQQSTFYGVHTVPFLGAEYCARIVAEEEKAPKKKNGEPTATLSAAERALRLKEYLRLNAEACFQCGSTKIVKDVLVGRECNVECKDCGTIWVERVMQVGLGGVVYRQQSRGNDAGKKRAGRAASRGKGLQTESAK